MSAPPRERASDGLSMVVQSGDFDRVHYALVIAAAAAATNRPVTLFFTMGALKALEATGADGTPPWRAMALSDGAGRGGALDDSFRARGVATFEELLTSCAAMGVHFLVCEMGLRAMALERSRLRADLPIEEGGVVTFLNGVTADGAVIFV